MVNIVELSSQRYLVDVGMSAKGPMVPVLLQENSSPFTSIAPRRVRLVREYLPEATSRYKGHECWQLQQCYNDDRPWISIYAFSDVEFIPADFVVMNWYINTHPRSWFTHKIMVGKMLLSEDGQEIVGDLTLYEKALRKRVRGRIELDVAFQSEEERILLLQEHFDIQLDAHERRSIHGTMSEIP